MLSNDPKGKQSPDHIIGNIESLCNKLSDSELKNYNRLNGMNKVDLLKKILECSLEETVKKPSE